MHRCSNERRTVHSGAIDRLAFDRNTHDRDARADRQPYHARTHDRQPHHARTHDREPHHARTHDRRPHHARTHDRQPHDILSDNAEPHDARADEPASDGSALDDDRVADAAAILRPELCAEPVALR
jgi:hypothetical protein